MVHGSLLVTTLVSLVSLVSLTPSPTPSLTLPPAIAPTKELEDSKELVPKGW
jgi:hypothetical protein